MKDVRTILKNFNKALLLEELTASSLPFLKADLYGFEKISQFVGAPSAEPRRISRVRESDGSYTEDYAQPGEIRFEFTTAPDGATLDALLAAHDSTQRTVGQQRILQDSTDMDTLIAQYPNIDAFNVNQVKNYLKLLARVVIRDRRSPPI